MIYRTANVRAGRPLREWSQWSRKAMAVAWIEAVAIKVKKNGPIQIYTVDWTCSWEYVVGEGKKEMILELGFLSYGDAIFWDGRSEVVQNIKEVTPDHLRFGLLELMVKNLFTKIYHLIWQNQRLSSYKGSFSPFLWWSLCLWNNVIFITRKYACKWIGENPSPHLAKQLKPVPHYYWQVKKTIQERMQRKTSKKYIFELWKPYGFVVINLNSMKVKNILFPLS